MKFKRWSWGSLIVVATLSITGCSNASSAPMENACALRMATDRGDVGLGFPKIADRGASTGTVNTAVIFVDFDDEQATRTPEDTFALIEGASDTFEEVSYGKLKYGMKPLFQWLRMSNNAADYSYEEFDTHQDFVVEALKLADDNGYDFSQIDSFVIVTSPDGSRFPNGPAFAGYQNEGIELDGRRLNNGATSGSDLTAWGSMWLNHEISHSMSLVDDYSFEGETETQWHRFVGQFGYMGYSSLDSNAPGLFAFERWQLGWIDETQVMCMPPSGGVATLQNVETPGGLKLAMIPLSQTKAIAIESRRPIGIDKNLAKAGALVYVLDTTKLSGLGPVVVQSNTSGDSDPWLTQAPLSAGESLSVEGYDIVVTSATDTSDTVVVTKRIE